MLEAFYTTPTTEDLDMKIRNMEDRWRRRVDAFEERIHELESQHYSDGK